MTDKTQSVRASLRGGRDPLVDGRQSEMALAISRGCARLAADLAMASLPEITLPNWRRADLMAISTTGDIWIVEIKSSVADFTSDAKWPEYDEYCDAFYFAVAPEFPQDILPDRAGIIVADRFGGEIVRRPQPEKLSAGRRKALMLLFARTAAARLQRLSDPDADLEQLPFR